LKMVSLPGKKRSLTGKKEYTLGLRKRDCWDTVKTKGKHDKIPTKKKRGKKKYEVASNDPAKPEESPVDPVRGKKPQIARALRGGGGASCCQQTHGELPEEEAITSRLNMEDAMRGFRRPCRKTHPPGGGVMKWTIRQGKRDFRPSTGASPSPFCAQIAESSKTPLAIGRIQKRLWEALNVGTIQGNNRFDCTDGESLTQSAH